MKIKKRELVETQLSSDKRRKTDEREAKGIGRQRKRTSQGQREIKSQVREIDNLVKYQFTVKSVLRKLDNTGLGCMTRQAGFSDSKILNYSQT